MKMHEDINVLLSPLTTTSWIIPFLNQAAVSNDSSQLLLKKDLLSKVRLEYKLWCPLIEKFAPNPFVPAGKGDDEALVLPGDVSAYPHTVTKKHEERCQESRARMQRELLGFVPNHSRIHGPARARTNGSARESRREKKHVRDAMRELSAAMSALFRAEYHVTDAALCRREVVRARVERAVAESGDFPPGTKVAVFGSSANGFG